MRGFLVMQMYKKSIEQYVPFAESIHFCRADGLRFAGLCYICRRMENGMKKYFGAQVSASGGVQNAPVNAHGIGAGGFALFAVEGFRCEAGEQIVHGQKENDAEDRSTSGGQPTGHSHGLRLLNGWDEQGPHAGGDHHASGKSK